MQHALAAKNRFAVKMRKIYFLSGKKNEHLALCFFHFQEAVLRESEGVGASEFQAF